MTNFTYDTTVPAAANNPSTDQPTMQTNCSSINGILAIDHVSFNAANGGTHSQVTFSSNNVPSIPTSPPVLFTNNDAYSTPQLFFYSGNTAKTSNQYAAGSAGSTYLFGGIILKWFTVAIGASDTFKVVTFASVGLNNFPNNAYVALVNAQSGSFYANYNALSTSQITIVRNPSSGAFTATVVVIGN